MNTFTRGSYLWAWSVITGQTNLGINDIGDVAGGQQRHPNKLEHVGQVGLSLFSVVLDPVQHRFKHGFLRVHLQSDRNQLALMLQTIYKCLSLIMQYFQLFFATEKT